MLDEYAREESIQPVALSELSLKKKAIEARSTYITKWRQSKTSRLAERSHIFIPCSHVGSCESALCDCFKAKINCERSCRCRSTCDRRFKGCECRRTGAICFQSDKCICFQLQRECDAELCGTCGASELLDPSNERHDQLDEHRCGNVGIQCNTSKRTILGSAGPAGFGLFMAESAKKNDCLGEYKSEMISQPESARRGASYHFQRVNYLFGYPSGGKQLSDSHLSACAEKAPLEQEGDGTHAGSKTRFINHSSDPKYINCYPGVYLCNTVKRIGFYASRDLRAGEEILFDYG